MIKRPPARKHLRRNRSHRQAKVAPWLDLSVSLVASPITGTFWSQFPEAQIAAPERMPVTLTFGDPPVIQVDMEAFFNEAVQFITEHPVLCTAIAAGIVFVICACNKPSRPAFA